MKALYRLFKRSNGIYYVENNQTGKQSSLKTRDRREAEQLLNAHNQDSSQTQLNREIGLTFIKSSDPELANRTWQKVFDAVCSNCEQLNPEEGGYTERTDVIRHKPLIETTSDDPLRLLKPLGSFDNRHLKLAQNYAGNRLDRSTSCRVSSGPRLRLSLKELLPLRSMSELFQQSKMPSRKAFYELLWWTGALKLMS